MERNVHQFEEFLQKFPKKNVGGSFLVQYGGFWVDPKILEGIINFQEHFQPYDSDIILASMPKAGTTWLKALTFSILNRKKYSVNDTPLLFNNPHKVVPFLELDLYKPGEIRIPDMHVDSIPSPRTFATHMPYQFLPNTVLGAFNCRIIYICRNPLDLYTSARHFELQNDCLPQGQSISLEEGFHEFCEGRNQYGPFWDHFLGYWEASLKDPKKVLFLKYEDLIMDINSPVKKMAEFLGCPFSSCEENEGLVEDIAKLCSLKNLKNLECNKNGEVPILFKLKNSSFFRKGGIGDWVNFLSPSMGERLQSLMKEKFAESGLTLNISGCHQ